MIAAIVILVYRIMLLLCLRWLDYAKDLKYVKQIS